ncbi:hypothetical protein CN514_05595 [Bacillus sp. AFS001701]|uniref:hypothetical protein n=1 Tax=Bacillus sp. AFS001701 TaxID=2033480 RepID=UPI000BF33D78|nr:hypothetical protein [Bacillus sp. AFS001701]PET71851.1 hypothetical protein CN514_05595 [Bacillus sp. AFS001701]
MSFNLTAALRLNDQSFTSGMRRASQAVSRMSSSSSSLTSQVAKIGAAFGATTLAVNTLKTAMQGAMQMETDKLTLSALVNDTEKANKLFDMLQQKGLKSVFSDADFMGAGKAFLPMTKDLGQINKLLGITERLASSNTLEGMTGASFAIREALSGDLVSLQERFNIPRSMLKETFKGADTATEKIAALDKVLNKLGFTQKFVNQVNTSASAQWQTLQSNVTTALGKMGTAALEKLKKPLTDINNWMQGGGLDFLKEKGSDFLAGAVTKAVEFGTYIKDNWPTIKQNFIDFNNSLQPIKDALSLAYDGIKKVAGYVMDNWPLVKEAIIGVTTAIVAFKTAMVGLTIINGIITLITNLRIAYGLLTGAQWALNFAMDANPVGAVILALSALVGVAVLLYRNWDIVKQKTTELWNKLGPFKGVFTALLGPIGSVVNAVRLLVSVWNKFKSSISNFKMPTFKLPSMGGGVLGLVGGKSHASGLANVPYNGYSATLHKGERVLTPEENEAYSKGKGKGGKGVTVNVGTMNVRQDSDIKKVAYELAKLIEKEGVQMA